MSFLAVLFALLLEQARPLGRGNPVHVGLRAWVRWCARNFDAGQPHYGWLAWSFAVVAPSLLSLGIYWLLNDWLGWPAAVVWSVVVLYVTLGFRQFSFHFTEIRDALAQGDEDRAVALLAAWRQVNVSEVRRDDLVRHVIEHSVLAAHRHVFGVLAWFSVLAAFGFGPAGAVLYRLSEFVARYWRHKSTRQDLPVSEALQQTAADAWVIIDWIPARISAMAFAVVGSFEDAIDSWRNCELRASRDNDDIILAATSGAVNIRLGDGYARAAPAGAPAGQERRDGERDSVAGQVPEFAHLRIVVGLVWRSVVLWMVLLALLTLAKLLG
ncbi:MAG: CobD/CbiB family protein [Rhodoferax sp.]|nr:CobD/CbiB family protein [Rhodoferax sp.]